ncbi:MAG: hypothetical protein KKA62_02850 [Nanoarchaeota archaeon]|nr:hypothetical protein [Nanoarchaeota archaeon]MBU1976870.1 hypothetical protein [Nanoarchaeota archaeon]
MVVLVALAFGSVFTSGTPSILEIKPLLGQAFKSGDKVIISARVTTNFSLFNVFTEITLPDESIQYQDLSFQENNTFSTIFTNTLRPGLYKLKVIALDSSNEINYSEPTNFMVYDLVPPSIRNIQTLGGTVFTKSESILISAEVKDNVEISVVQAEITKPDLSTEKIILVSLSENNYGGSLDNIDQTGEYVLRIIANDTSDNINTSEEVTFTIEEEPLIVNSKPLLETMYTVMSGVDLTLNSSDIQFSNLIPLEGEVILINATIYNLGDTVATTVVQFLDDGIEIINQTLYVGANSSNTTTINWTSQLDLSTISVIIDPENSVAESNESNNNASANISIDSSSIFYGSAAGSLALGLDFDLVLDLASQVKNIYLADTDSNVNFNSLQALGRKDDSSTSSDDFTEVDTALNMSSFNSSITNLYSIDGTNPKTVRSFNIYDVILSNVSIINSTNSSTFQTGILWDMSDDDDGEYDSIDQEDLVFVTETNSSQVGRFGTYDYEIKVPVLLRNYKPNTNTVSIYLEID